uniref:Enoyl reductase (ER) domain-containing protein n=1 Tax=Branchiostoma floridae TaxID=7739 RepID=C3Z1I1_BRAFL|eukprot:XP_002597587.1 hypothetical protein BRAFLDRAFT_82307 [Branchiostoma floridae]
MARRSMRLVEFGKPFQLTKEEVPTAPKGGAVVKTEYAGVCHSDVHLMDGHYPIPLNTVLGHEIAGTVHDIEPGQDLKVGDRVAVHFRCGCGDCSRCEVGERIACLRGVKQDLGSTDDGGFSDYVIIPDVRLLVKEEKLTTAREAGCDGTLMWGKDVDDDTAVTEAKKICGSLGGFAAAIDFVNVAATFERIEKILAEGGMHVLVGLMGVGAPASVPLMPYVMSCHQMASLRVGSLPQLKDLMALVAQGKIKPPPISHHPLENVYDVLVDLKAGKVKGRAVVKL